MLARIPQSFFKKARNSLSSSRYPLLDSEEFISVLFSLVSVGDAVSGIGGKNRRAEGGPGTRHDLSGPVFRLIRGITNNSTFYLTLLNAGSTRRAFCFPKPFAHRIHLFDLRRRRVSAATGIFLCSFFCPPANLHTIIRVVSHLKSGFTR